MSDSISSVKPGNTTAASSPPKPEYKDTNQLRKLVSNAAYSTIEAAKKAGGSGRIPVEITIDPSGKVVATVPREGNDPATFTAGYGVDARSPEEVYTEIERRVGRSVSFQPFTGDPKQAKIILAL